MGLIFAPLFFAIIGAQVDFREVNVEVLMLSGIIIVVAIVTKLFGCGLPAWLFLKDKARGMRVGIGMISRGEVGLIVAGVGVSSGVLTGSVYSTIVIMVAVTTIITPIWLKMEYRKELKRGDGTEGAAEGGGGGGGGSGGAAEGGGKSEAIEKLAEKEGFVSALDASKATVPDGNAGRK